MKIILLLSRIISGSVFIFSGFLKSLNPSSTAMKINEYLNIFNSELSFEAALFFAILLITVEFTTGLALLTAGKQKLSSWILLIMMIFFTALSFFIAVNEPISDCGCFGESIIITNLQTFYKNLFLTALAIIIFINRKKVKPVFSSKIETLILSGGILFIIGFSLLKFFL